jgi:hypothetical protein
MNLEKLKDSARKFEQKEDWRKAIEVYLKAIQQIESGAESSPDLSLYNRVGDLYLKINDTAAAVRSCGSTRGGPRPISSWPSSTRGRTSSSRPSGT